MSITLPKLPDPFSYDHHKHCVTYSLTQLRARDIEVAKAVLEAAARVLDGECLDHLQRAIRNLKVSHAN